MTQQTARIPILKREAMTAEQEVVLDAIVGGKRGEIVGPLLAAIHNPALADAWQKFGAVLRFDSVFEAKYSELAILLTARRWNSELEWVVHREAAERAGLSADIFEAIREHKIPNFDDPKMALIYDYITQLQNTGQVDSAFHAGVSDAWGTLGVIELTALTGYYAMVAMTLNAHQITLPAGRVAELYPNGEAAANALSELPARCS